MLIYFFDVLKYKTMKGRDILNFNLKIIIKV